MNVYRKLAATDPPPRAAALLRVPRALSEHQVAARLPRLHGTGERSADPVISPMADHMRGARELCEKAAGEFEAIANDPWRPAEGRRLAARDRFLARVADAAKQLDKAATMAAEGAKKLDAAMRPPQPKTAADLSVAGEVRARLAAMDDRQRGNLLSAAIEANDGPVLAAFFGAPAFVSGARPEELQRRLRQWRMRHHGSDFERMQRIVAANDAVTRAGEALAAWAHEVASDRAVSHIEAAARAADAYREEEREAKVDG